MSKNTDQKNIEYGHVLRSVLLGCYYGCAMISFKSIKFFLYEYNSELFENNKDMLHFVIMDVDPALIRYCLELWTQKH